VRAPARLVRYAELSLASKFGVDLADAKRRCCRRPARWRTALGICFHVGSQAMSPFAYVQALERVRAAIVDASVTVDIVDVGGGFPSVYPGMEPPPLEDCISMRSTAAFEALPVSYSPNCGASRAGRSARNTIR
jgi:ornithine decarboxylase